MNCEWTKDHLFSFIDRELDQQQERILKEHLGVCRACRHEYEKIQRAWDALDCWEDALPPERVRKNLLQEIRSREKSKWLSVAFPAAAVLLIVAGITFFYKSDDAGVYRQLTAENEKAAIRVVKDISQENEEDIVSNLQLLREKDFFDSLDKLEKIDYLPLVEDRQNDSGRDQRSSLDLDAA